MAIGYILGLNFFQFMQKLGKCGVRVTCHRVSGKNVEPNRYLCTMSKHVLADNISPDVHAFIAK